MIRDACWWWQQSNSSFLGLLLFGSSLLASTLVASVCAHSPESTENLAFSVSIGDLGKLNGARSPGNRQNLAGHLVGGGGGLKLLGGRVVDLALLGLVLASGENNQLALVSVQSSDVQLELLLTGAGSSVINGDSNCSCESRGKSGVSKFDESETTAVANFASISASSLGNNRTQVFSRSGEDTGSLGNSILVSLKLLSRLVEVSLGSSGPVLAKMDIDDHVVVLDHS